LDHLFISKILILIWGVPLSYAGKFLPNGPNKKLLIGFITFVLGGFGAWLGFIADAFSIRWLGIIAFSIVAFSVFSGFIFILFRWWKNFK
jgi:hypothetical protein